MIVTSFAAPKNICTISTSVLNVLNPRLSSVIRYRKSYSTSCHSLCRKRISQCSQVQSPWKDFAEPTPLVSLPPQCICDQRSKSSCIKALVGRRKYRWNGKNRIHGMGLSESLGLSWSANCDDSTRQSGWAWNTRGLGNVGLIDRVIEACD